MGTRNRHLCGSVECGASFQHSGVSWIDETGYTSDPGPHFMQLTVSTGDPIRGARATARACLNRAELDELIDGLTKARAAMDEPTKIQGAE